MYISNHSPRKIPVGYSAADDLRFRISLAHYLECGDEFTSADFYGVNSYQWCGHQSFTSSGYDSLVADYKDYSLPIFLSEYGCNAVYPRLFQEVLALYTPEMTEVFSGGLVYEFTQEPNNYGLVELDQSGNAYTIGEFDTLKEKFNQVNGFEPRTPQENSRPTICKEEYDNINLEIPIPSSFGVDMIAHGLPVRRGTFVHVTVNATMHRIYNTNGEEMTNKEIKILQPLTLQNPDRTPNAGMFDASNSINNTTHPGIEYATVSDGVAQPTLPSNIARRVEERKHLDQHKKLNGGFAESSASVYPSSKASKVTESTNSGGKKQSLTLLASAIACGFVGIVYGML
ncbi:Gas4p [Sugiyamaella lignohabitans]|uniref:1,3-beta-glucanosyltransferase n=1 Tax=Sugiyamaella lignohabitans TaxID=796027 RepID=A0A161HKQ3_9ASCO|nr:Gas4p [Sugiyamaella lignohabitans]ANB12378.1 Gas4p [Sugiyamaella lignohabitans]